MNVAELIEKLQEMPSTSLIVPPIRLVLSEDAEFVEVKPDARY